MTKCTRIARASTINAALSLYRTSRAFSNTRAKALDRYNHPDIWQSVKMTDFGVLARLSKKCAQDDFWNSIAVVVSWVAQHSLCCQKVTILTSQKGVKKVSKSGVFGTPKSAFFNGLARSRIVETFHGYPVSNSHVHPCVGPFWGLTQLLLLIYCLVWGPLKLGFGPLKVGFWGGVILGRGYPQNLTPPNSHFLGLPKSSGLTWCLGSQRQDVAISHVGVVNILSNDRSYRAE